MDFLGATRRGIKGWRIAYSPDFDVFPVDRRVAEVVGKTVQAFEAAGATVEAVRVGIKRPQRELSDAWCRLIIGINIAAIEEFKRQGLDLLNAHREDFPPQFLAWVEKGFGMSVREFLRDQELRTEVYDAAQSVFAKYDLLITPTLATLPVDNVEDGNTVELTRINSEAVDPLIGWCLTHPVNFTGHPAASIPAGLSEDNLPVGMQIIGRRYADGDVLAASAVFEGLRPWRESYQICAARPSSPGAGR